MESSAARRRRSLWPQGRTRFTSTAITCSPRIWPQGSRAGFQVNSVEVGSSRRFPRWTNRTAPLGRTLRVPISSPSRGAGRIRVLDVGPAEGSRRWAHPGRTPQDEVLPSLHEAQLVERVDRLPLNRPLEAEVEVRQRRDRLPSVSRRRLRRAIGAASNPSMASDAVVPPPSTPQRLPSRASRAPGSFRSASGAAMHSRRQGGSRPPSRELPRLGPGTAFRVRPPRPLRRR